MVKAINIVFEDWGDDADDFFISYQIDVGPEEIEHESYMYTVDVISPSRLEKNISSGFVEIGRGYLIMTDFNSKAVKDTVERIVQMCKGNDYEQQYQQLSKYMRWEMDE